ncbi:MAG: hypothetical protein KIT14_24415 [bacterium]|nr:hypothetical protein [bacterium]
MTTPGALHEASTRELALWRELVAAYGDLQALLADPETLADPVHVGLGRERAERCTAELQALRAVLGPWRVDGTPVPADVRALWRASAELATEAAALNARLVEQARARQDAMAARLRTLDAGRRGFGYRPAVARTATVAARA